MSPTHVTAEPEGRQQHRSSIDTEAVHGGQKASSSYLDRLAGAASQWTPPLTRLPKAPKLLSDVYSPAETTKATAVHAYVSVQEVIAAADQQVAAAADSAVQAVSQTAPPQHEEIDSMPPPTAAQQQQQQQQQLSPPPGKLARIQEIIQELEARKQQQQQQQQQQAGLSSLNATEPLQPQPPAQPQQASSRLRHIPARRLSFPSDAGPAAAAPGSARALTQPSAKLGVSTDTDTDMHSVAVNGLSVIAAAAAAPDCMVLVQRAPSSTATDLGPRLYSDQGVKVATDSLAHAALGEASWRQQQQQQQELKEQSSWPPQQREDHWQRLQDLQQQLQQEREQQHKQRQWRRHSIGGPVHGIAQQQGAIVSANDSSNSGSSNSAQPAVGVAFSPMRQSRSSVSSSSAGGAGIADCKTQQQQQQQQEDPVQVMRQQEGALVAQLVQQWRPPTLALGAVSSTAGQSDSDWDCSDGWSLQSGALMALEQAKRLQEQQQQQGTASERGVVSQAGSEGAQQQQQQQQRQRPGLSPRHGIAAFKGLIGGSKIPSAPGQQQAQPQQEGQHEDVTAPQSKQSSAKSSPRSPKLGWLRPKHHAQMQQLQETSLRQQEQLQLAEQQRQQQAQHIIQLQEAMLQQQEQHRQQLKSQQKQYQEQIEALLEDSQKAQARQLNQAEQLQTQLLQQHAQKQQQLQQLYEQHQQELRRREKVVEAQLRDMQRRESALRQHQQQMQRRESELELRERDVQQGVDRQLERCQGLEAQVEVLQLRIDQAGGEVQDLQEQLLQTQAEKSELQGRQKTKRLQEEQERLLESNIELQEQHQHLMLQHLRQVDESKGLKIQLQEQEGKLQQDMAVREESLNECHRQLQEAKTLLQAEVDQQHSHIRSMIQQLQQQEQLMMADVRAAKGVYLVDLKTETQRNHELSQQLLSLKAKHKETTAKLKQLQKDHARLLDRKLEGDRRNGTLQQKLQQLKQQKGSSANSGSGGGGAGGGVQLGWNQGFSSVSGGQGWGVGKETATGAPGRRQQQQQQQGAVTGGEVRLIGATTAAAAGGEETNAAVAAEHQARLAAEAKAAELESENRILSDIIASLSSELDPHSSQPLGHTNTPQGDAANMLPHQQQQEQQQEQEQFALQHLNQLPMLPEHQAVYLSPVKGLLSVTNDTNAAAAAADPVALQRSQAAAAILQEQQQQVAKRHTKHSSKHQSSAFSGLQQQQPKVKQQQSRPRVQQQEQQDNTPAQRRLLPDLSDSRILKPEPRSAAAAVADVASTAAGWRRDRFSSSSSRMEPLPRFPEPEVGGSGMGVGIRSTKVGRNGEQSQGFQQQQQQQQHGRMRLRVRATQQQQQQQQQYPEGQLYERQSTSYELFPRWPLPQEPVMPVVQQQQQQQQCFQQQQQAKRFQQQQQQQAGRSQQQQQHQRPRHQPLPAVIEQQQQPLVPLLPLQQQQQLLQQEPSSAAAGAAAGETVHHESRPQSGVLALVAETMRAAAALGGLMSPSRASSPVPGRTGDSSNAAPGVAGTGAQQQQQQQQWQRPLLQQQGPLALGPVLHQQQQQQQQPAQDLWELQQQLGLVPSMLGQAGGPGPAAAMSQVNGVPQIWDQGEGFVGFSSPKEYSIGSVYLPIAEASSKSLRFRDLEGFPASESSALAVLSVDGELAVAEAVAAAAKCRNMCDELHMQLANMLGHTSAVGNSHRGDTGAAVGAAGRVNAPHPADAAAVASRCGSGLGRRSGRSSRSSKVRSSTLFEQWSELQRQVLEVEALMLESDQPSPASTLRASATALAASVSVAAAAAAAVANAGMDSSEQTGVCSFDTLRSSNSSGGAYVDAQDGCLTTADALSNQALVNVAVNMIGTHLRVHKTDPGQHDSLEPAPAPKALSSRAQTAAGAAEAEVRALESPLRAGVAAMASRLSLGLSNSLKDLMPQALRG